jgi:hypothetical protein
MTWADLVLRLLLKPRDRDTISGDLLEEYRERVLPARGPLAAHVWYLRQVLSFVTPVAWGIAIGIVAGAWNLISTAMAPLAEDTAFATMLALGALLLLWVMATSAAGQRSRGLRDTITAGVLMGVATLAVFHLAGIIRVNVFMEQIRDRDDWQNLVARFRASNFHDLRAYATYEYIKMTPMLLAFGAIAGGISGALSGVIRNLINAER